VCIVRKRQLACDNLVMLHIASLQIPLNVALTPVFYD
jgi:hypothetical protein